MRQDAKILGKPFLGIGELVELLRKDATARSLAISNAITIVLALIEHWPLKTLLFIYCGQNVIIGFFNVIRILNIKSLEMPRKPSGEMPPVARYFLAGFFAVHYGFFQFGYFQFIGRPDASEWGWIWLSLAVFVAHHLFSFNKHMRKEAVASDFSRLMFFPYLRIMPMHITIIFGGFLMMLFRNDLADRLVLILFLLLKTNTDLKMHQVEHEDKGPLVL